MIEGKGTMEHLQNWNRFPIPLVLFGLRYSRSLYTIINSPAVLLSSLLQYFTTPMPIGMSVEKSHQLYENVQLREPPWTTWYRLHPMYPRTRENQSYEAIHIYIYALSFPSCSCQHCDINKSLASCKAKASVMTTCRPILSPSAVVKMNGWSVVNQGWHLWHNASLSLILQKCERKTTLESWHAQWWVIVRYLVVLTKYSRDSLCTTRHQNKKTLRARTVFYVLPLYMYTCLQCTQPARLVRAIWVQ